MSRFCSKAVSNKNLYKCDIKKKSQLCLKRNMFKMKYER
jgi:hypothetical protein